MSATLKTVLIVTGCALLASLLYTKLPLETMSGKAPTPPTPSFARESGVASTTVRINGQTLRVDVADTPKEREQGLGGRHGLAEDEGMLFVFQTDGRWGFWMKDMLFSIDIVWLSGEGKVVDTIKNVAPDTYPAYSFLPNVPARYVLELPAGLVTRYNVQIGDSVKF